MLFPYRDSVPSRRTPVVTYTLIAINVLVFLWMWQLPPKDLHIFVAEHGFVPGRIAQLRNPQQVVHVRLSPEVLPAQLQRAGAVPVVQLRPEPTEIYLSLITAMFMHGGWLHLISNMWFLWIFGNNVEDRLGHLTYAAFYLVGGILASLSHWWVEPVSTVPVVGASGAVAAVLGAYAVAFPTANVSCLLFLLIFVTIVDLPALVVLGFWFAQQLLQGFGAIRGVTTGGVAWWAHIGGFVAGVIIMLLVGRDEDERKPQPAWYEDLRQFGQD